MTLYGEDLAYIHEAGFGWFALRSATGLLALLRKHGIDSGTVVDLGCGGGVWPRQLGFAGYSAIGVDASPAMIRMARKTAPSAKFLCADAAQIDLPPCDAVTSLGEVFSYSGELSRVIPKVFGALRSGGVFIFDVNVVRPRPARANRKDWWGGEDWTVLLEAVESDGVVTRTLTTYRRRGAAWRRSVEIHRLRLYEPEAVEAELRQAGFEPKGLRGYGEVRFRSGHAGFLARKPI